MIYLLQDCYLDDNNEYQKILKIGYSDKPFKESRETQYNTHNFGYKFLGEKEGSRELESYLQGLFDSLRLGGEWFKYSEEVITKFWETSEENISPFQSQEDLNEYIRFYILRNLIPSFEYLRETYLDMILGEIEEKSKSSEFDFQEFKSIYQKEILRTFKLVVDSEKNFWENFDFSSETAIKSLKECSLDLPQIVGRQRNRENPFKNDIIVFYKTNSSKSSSWQNKNDFNQLQKERKEKTIDLLNLYQRAIGDGEKQAFIGKLRDSIQVSKYSGDFVSISRKTNLPVYNSLIEISNERAWEVSQEDYQDSINVTKAIEDQGYVTDLYQSQDEEIIKDFLDNHFYKTGLFTEKMRMYCEFRDTYQGNIEILDILNHKIPDQKYKQYYEYFGTSGCRAVSYVESKLNRHWKDTAKEGELISAITVAFKVGDRVLVSEAKTILNNIYASIGITRKAKATDLGKYFTLTKTKITLPDKTVKDGFKLGPKISTV